MTSLIERSQSVNATIELRTFSVILKFHLVILTDQKRTHQLIKDLP